MGAKPVERKRYFINRPFQGAFLRQMLGITLSIGVVMYLVSYHFFDSIFKQAVESGLGNNSQFVRYLLEVHTQLIITMLMAFVFIAAMVMLYAVWHSHRIAGPLEKLRSNLEHLAEGSPPEEIRFRKNDYFQELAEAFNRYIKRVKNEN